MSVRATVVVVDPAAALAEGAVLEPVVLVVAVPELVAVRALEAAALELVAQAPEVGLAVRAVLELALALGVLALALVVQAPEVVPLAVVQVPAEPVLALVVQAPEVVPLAVVQVPAEPVLAVRALALVVQAPEVVPLAVVEVLAEPALEVLALELVVQVPEVVPLAVVQVPAEPMRALEVPAPEVARPAEPVLEVQALEVVPLAVVQVPAEPVRALEVQALEVLALEVPALEVPALEVVRLAEPVRVAQALRAVVRVRVAEAQVAPVLALAAPRVAQQPRAPAEPERVARPVQERQAWQAAEVEPLRPPSAVAQRVPLSQEPSVEAPLAALAHRVRSVPLPALPASALRPAAGHPTGPRMAPPQGHPARTEALGAGHGAIFRRPILPRRSPAAISCVRYISGASSSRARRTA